jgi:hypothetical protein
MRQKLKIMKKIVIILMLILSNSTFSQKKEIKPYINYLNKIEKKSAKEYILQQFENHDIVILCERDHRDLTQYELIKDILSDDYFKENVKNLFTEIGVINLQPEITDFLKIKGLDSLYVEDKLSKFQFNASFGAIWEVYNYHYLLKTIYDINNSSNNQISYYPSDVEFDWSQVLNAEDYNREMEFDTEPRDSIIAFNIINQFEKIKFKKNKKALVILNYRHAFKIHTIGSNSGYINKNAAKYLFDYFGDRAINILISQTNFNSKGNDLGMSLIQNGKWDASFKFLNIDDLGFDFKDNIFGEDNLDIWDVKSLKKYEETFDGFVFYKPIEEYNLVAYFDGLIPKGMEEEFFRRYKIHLESKDNQSQIKKHDSEDFRKKVLKELTTTKERKHPNIKALMETRDNYLKD